MMVSMAPTKVLRIRGKPETFDEDENAAIRAALKGYVQRNKLTGEQLGEKLEVSQQTAGGYVNGKGGFSWPAARMIAWMLGYEGVDELLKEHGAFKTPGGKHVTGSLSPREDGIRAAQRLGVSETAISRVNERVGDVHHIARWWVDKYIQEQYAVDEERMRALDAKQAKSPKPKHA